MAVLELSAESRALREAAKGWSAGSIPRDDYRMIRRATLGAMLGIDPDEEDTIAGIVDLSGDDTETVEHIPQQAAGGGKRNTALIIAAAVLVIVGGAAALLLAG
jgi:hypothetical protein